MTTTGPVGGLRLARRVGLVVGVVVLLTTAGWFLDDELPAPEVALILALLAAGAGSAATLLVFFAARLTEDDQAGWLSMALGWYSVVVIPLSMICLLYTSPSPRDRS